MTIEKHMHSVILFSLTAVEENNMTIEKHMHSVMLFSLTPALPEFQPLNDFKKRKSSPRREAPRKKHHAQFQRERERVSKKTT
jgi:hypothetical protein